MKRATPGHCSSVAALPNAHERRLEVASTASRGLPTRATLGDLFRGNAQFIARSLRRLGVPASDVEDAVQEVFMIASRKMDQIVDGAERSFLYGTAMRVASNARRFDRRALAHRSDEPLEGASADVDPSPNAEDLIDQRQARATLDAVLETMSVEMRAVFTLFELEEMTTNEIASLLGVPAGTVSSRLWRAREHFEAAMRSLASGDRGPEESWVRTSFGGALVGLGRAREAIEALDGSEVFGRRLAVREAHERPGGSAKPKRGRVESKPEVATVVRRGSARPGLRAMPESDGRRWQAPAEPDGLGEWAAEEPPSRK